MLDNPARILSRFDFVNPRFNSTTRFIEYTIRRPFYCGQINMRHAVLCDKNSTGETRVAEDVAHALVAFLCLGFVFFALKLVVMDLGAFLPVFVFREVSALILALILIATNRRTRIIGLKAVLLTSLFLGGIEGQAIVNK